MAFVLVGDRSFAFHFGIGGLCHRFNDPERRRFGRRDRLFRFCGCSGSLSAQQQRGYLDADFDAGCNPRDAMGVSRAVAEDTFGPSNDQSSAPER